MDHTVYSLCVWLLCLNIMSVRFICVVVLIMIHLYLLPYSRQITVCGLAAFLGKLSLTGTQPNPFNYIFIYVNVPQMQNCVVAIGLSGYMV